MSPELWIAYILACCVVVIVPGPSVTVIIANSARYGARAGLANVIGTQAGIGLALLALAAGFATMMALVSDWFVVIKLIGALYLIWLGIRMWRSDGKLIIPQTAGTVTSKPLGRFFVEGFLVAVTNPKILLFFGAFIPQFMNAETQSTGQVVALGVVFMTVATFFDSLYAFAAGNAGKWLAVKRVRLVERIAGSLLIGGGIWLVMMRR